MFRKLIRRAHLAISWGACFGNSFLFRVYCCVCFRCFIHMPRGRLAASTHFKANLKKEIIFLPAKTAGCCVQPFLLEMGYGH